MRILITGAAGFIGFHLASTLLKEGHTVIGLDNLNDYYSVSLKLDRLALIKNNPNFIFVNEDMANSDILMQVFAKHVPDCVVNLAAQAGVRYSLINPQAYVQTNLVGFANILECCRHHEVKHLLFASSSSVYGLNQAWPFRVEDNVDHPVSLYAASKKSNELMAHAYSHLFNLPCTGLRFFTVYGPWGRPDMALHLFTSAILEGKPIKVFNQGRMLRDFTYIDDIIGGIVRLIPLAPAPNPTWDARNPSPADSSAPWRIFNIGNHSTVTLMEFIETLERLLGKDAIKEYLPMQPGDVEATCADVATLTAVTGFDPSTLLETGMKAYLDWHLDYYGHNKN